ncbi:NAD(P)/FAD-dependent oxidoreductase [Pragia fontium]|uniref:NAD(P)/FAD-dependent oxidoreductase n=1 Tax=Pragia fontium TaxID=82985 RepID=UPI00064AB770|nr:FAD-dependent oxidoreductase [Pragia fontium]AKJ40787.1 pyridine nucleotide-disulfide oxidoreductase [Pragia fontium]
MSQNQNQQNDAGIVIIGGGQAGGWAAKTLRDSGYNGKLSVISDEPHDFYERPPLSKAVLLDQDGQLGLTRLFTEEAVAALDIDWHRPLRAEAILPADKTVVLNNGETLPYRQLLIATGGRPRRPEGLWQSHPKVLTLRSWNDAVQLRTQLAQAKTLAIVGGGWIGLEIAASARKMGVAVTVFERQSALCLRSIGAEVSQALLELHQNQGVEVICGCGEITLNDDNGRPQLKSELTESQTFGLVVVGIGVILNLELAEQAGLTVRNGGIVVDDQGRTSDPSIFAVGDVALHSQLGVCLQSWAYAQNQAVTTARSMLDAGQPGYQEDAWLWSDQYSENIQILGIPASGSHCITREDDHSKVYFYLNADNQLVQMVAFNDARTIKLGKRWLAAQRVLDPAQLSDPSFSLMALK